MNDSSVSPNTPVARFRIGQVQASIWEKDGRHSVTLQKSYKDSEDKWQNTDFLSHGDVLNAAKLLERVEDWMARQKKAS